MKRIKKAAAVFLAAVMTGALSITSFAASKINSVDLDIDSNITAGDSDSDVDVSTDSSKYYVDDVDVTNEPSDEWEENDKPKLKITLYASDDYEFASGLSKSDVDISGSDGTVTSVSRTSSRLYVYVTLDKLDDDDDDDYDLDVSNLEWDDSDGTASWDDSEDAKRYDVRLYRDGSSVTSAISTTDTSYNFGSYFTKAGDYTFKVRAVYNSSNKGDWEESESLDVTSSEARDIRNNAPDDSSSSSSSSSSGGPGGSSTGAWLEDAIGWWYCNADRSYTVSNWQYINNKWYYFNENGYMVTGWVFWNNLWYYCGPDGDMLVSTQTPDGYYVDANGVWIQ